MDYHKAWKNTSKDWRMAAVCPWGWRSPLYSCTCCKRSCRTDFVKREVHTIVNNLNQRCPEKAANWASTPWSMNRSAKMGQESGTGERPGTWGRRSTRRKGAYIWQKFLSILAGFQYIRVISFFRVIISMGSISDAECRCRVVIMMSNNNFWKTKCKNCAFVVM